MGRPKADIDWLQVDNFLKAHCDGVAIAGILGICPMTLYRAVEDKYKVNFVNYAQQKKAEGVSLMENSIYNDAMSKGGVDRMFWLKNKAGWKDKQEVEHSGSVNIELPQVIFERNSKNDTK